MRRIISDVKLSVVKIAISAMAYSFFFIGFSLKRMLLCVGILVGSLFMGLAYEKMKEKTSYIYHHMIAILFDVFGAYVFYQTWIPSSRLQTLALHMGGSGSFLLTIICTIIALIGHYVMLCTAHILCSALIIVWRGMKELRATTIECKSLLLPTAVVFVLTNIVFIIHQNVHPDAYNEGFAIYQGADWALSLGRWAIRFINLSTNNVVMPIFNLVLSYVCIFLSGIVIIDIFGIKNKIHRFLTLVILLVTPTVICQYMYIYMENAYSIGVLLASVSAYAMIKRKSIFAAVSLSIALGCYQSYIGFTAVLVLLFLIIQLLEVKSDFTTIIVDAVRYMLNGIAGCVLYYILLKINFSLFKVTFADYGGASNIGILNSFSKLVPSIKEAYLSFIRFYTNGNVLLILYLLLFLTIVILVCVKKVSLLKKSFSILLLLSLPAVMNCIVFIAPDHEISILMQHQSVLIVPFLFVLMEEELLPVFKNLDQVVVVLCFMICFIYGITAFCTQYSLNYAQKYTDLYASAAITHILNSDDYEQGDRILFAGVLDESEIQKNNVLYKYSSYKKNSVVGDFKYAMLNGWKNYLNARLSFNIGTVTDEEYDNIVQSEDFLHMKCYPDKNAIIKMGDIYVVKVEADPPLNE